jgi:hypothetical protein
MPIVAAAAIAPFVPLPEDPEAKAWAVTRPAREQRVTLPRPDKQARQEWKMVPMAGGPAVYTSCVGPDRLYAMNKVAWRGTEGLWPDAALTVAPGACRARAKR